MPRSFNLPSLLGVSVLLKVRWQGREGSEKWSYLEDGIVTGVGRSWGIKVCIRRSRELSQSGRIGEVERRDGSQGPCLCWR